MKDDRKRVYIIQCIRTGEIFAVYDNEQCAKWDVEFSEKHGRKVKIEERLVNGMNHDRTGEMIAIDNNSKLGAK